MEGKTILAFSIPLFFLLIGIEAWVARRRRLRVYRFTDAVTDIACGAGSQIGGFFLGHFLTGNYLALYEHRLLTPAEGPLLWIGAIIGQDFLFYWYHRLSHEVNALWAIHIVHHQSEDFTLAVALRQATFANLISWTFYLPLALFGVPIGVFGVVYALNLIYQFWVHTELIHRVPAVERVFVTPEHHRVHHAQNPRYLDKNYGGMLILWDKLLGTFMPESEPPVYGITKPLRSMSPLWAQVHYWLDLWKEAVRAPRWQDKLKVWVMPPWWSPEGLPPKETHEVSRATFEKYDPQPEPWVRRYVTAHMVLLALGIGALMLTGRGWPLSVQVGVSVQLALMLTAWGLLFEQKRSALTLEAVRCGFLLGAVPLWLAGTPWFWPGIAAALLLSTLSLSWLFRSWRL